MINNQIQSVYYNEEYVGLVFRNMTGESTYSLDIYDAVGNKEKTIHFNQEYNEIMFCEESVLIYNEEECSIYDGEGKVKYEGTFKERIECIIPLGNIQKYILVTNDSIQMIKLQ